MSPYHHIYVFKTAKAAGSYLEEIECVMQLFHNKIRWNTDLEDCDNILKVETDSIKSSEIIAAMTNAGFYCEELN